MQLSGNGGGAAEKLKSSWQSAGYNRLANDGGHGTGESVMHQRNIYRWLMAKMA